MCWIAATDAMLTMTPLPLSIMPLASRWLRKK